MKKNTLINVAILASAVVLVAVLGFYVKVGTTADSIAVLKTTGMTCGSCSSKITKSLESMKGVAVTEVDVESGWVVVGYDTKTTKPDVLAKKVTEAGFTSSVYQVLTPDQFQQITGRNIGKSATPSGCCGGKGGCGSNTKS